MIKNITQTVKIPAAQLIPSQVPKDLVGLFANLASTDKNSQSYQDLKAEIISKLPEKIKRELENIGAELPTDLVPITMRLSDFLFDLFLLSSTPPEAPLARAVFQRKCMDVAAAFDKESFEIPPDVAQFIRKSLTDDATWKRLKPVVTLTVNNETRPFTLSYLGANLFGDILDIVVKIFDETATNN